MNPEVKRIAAMRIDEALDRRRIRSSAIRNELIARAEIGGGYSPEIRIRQDSGELISIDHAVDKLKSEPRFRHYFPPEPLAVPLNDAEAVRKNFAKLASGEVTGKYL